MRLMVAVARVLSLCAVVLAVLPAIVASQLPPPPPPLPPPTPQRPPQLTFSLNQNSFQPGDTHILSAGVSPGDRASPVDVYLALQLPDQTLLFYQSDGSFTQAAQPLVGNWTVIPHSGEIFRYAFSGAEPAGTYTWYAAFTDPGTLNVIGDIAQAPFTFTLSAIACQPAHAKLGPISIRSVYMTDGNFTLKTVFAPGTRINYHVDVDNTTSSSFPIKIRFEVFANYATKPNLYSYDQTYDVAQMPVGCSRFYNPVTLPSNPAIYWYILRITITRSDCQGVDCANDVGTSTFNIQTTGAPEGKAQNLIVLVHGCCTDANDVIEVWDSLGTLIQSQTPEAWEVLVWNWHEFTPKRTDTEYIKCPECFVQDANTAYQEAQQQGGVLANAIKIHSYKHVHLIGHSAGAKLIHEAATAYIYDYFVRQQNPFIHLTFLDAYTPSDWDKNSYGSLPTNYPNSYAEHYVDRGLPLTDACLANAFNFDITQWTPDKDDGPLEFGHQWPHRWYKKSVTPLFTGYKYGYPLSLEGGNGNYKELANLPIKGKQCALSDIKTDCVFLQPDICWKDF